MTVYALFNRRVTIFGIPENIGVRSFFFLGKSRVSLLNLAAFVLWVVFIVTALNKKPLKIDFLASYAEQLSGKVKP